jgi:hypothetical protein
LDFRGAGTTTPHNSNADEWHLFLSHYLDNRATQPDGLNHVAMQIAKAIQNSFDLGFKAAGGLIHPLNEDPSGQRREPMSPHPSDDEPPFECPDCGKDIADTETNHTPSCPSRA